MNYGQAALPFATREVGSKESPANSNDGPRVRLYQAVTGAYRQPWCASFVMYCLKQAGYDTKGRFLNSAYVPYILTRGKQLGLAVPIHSIRSGDLVCFDWGHDGTPDHIGFATGPVSAGLSFPTIEGNTAFGNESNGGQVMRRTRRTADVAGVIRLPAKPAPPKPHPVYDLDAPGVKIRNQKKLGPVMARAQKLVAAGKRVVLSRRMVK